MRTCSGLLAFLLVAEARPSPAQVRWHSEIGVAGGYTRTHTRGRGLVVDFTELAAPGVGSATGNATPTTLFAIVPVGGRFALEPGVDAHGTQDSGRTDVSAIVWARLDYAVSGGWYAGLGGGLHYLDKPGAKAIAVAGLGAAWGYRFHLAGSFDGRFELNYSAFKERIGFPFAANTLGLMFGAMIPLK